MNEGTIIGKNPYASKEQYAPANLKLNLLQQQQNNNKNFI